MSLNTQYGGWVLQWSSETFGDALRGLLPPNNTVEQQRDIFDFDRAFLDPRVEHYYGHIIKVKDHWFLVFQKWVKDKKNVDIEKPEKCFLSMCIHGDMQGLSIEDYARIKMIEFKENKKAE